MIGKVRTCLWFDDEPETAASLCVSLIPGSRIERVFHGAFETIVEV